MNLIGVGRGNERGQAVDLEGVRSEPSSSIPTSFCRIGRLRSIQSGVARGRSNVLGKGAALYDGTPFPPLRRRSSSEENAFVRGVLIDQHEAIGHFPSGRKRSLNFGTPMIWNCGAFECWFVSVRLEILEVL